MNRRGIWVGAAVLAGVLVSQVARADDSAPAARTDVEPSNGVPFKFRTGFFTEVQLGFFTVFGGEKGVSNGQPYGALSLGYEIPIPSSWTKQLTLFLTGAYGANAGSCRATMADASSGQTVCQQYPLDDMSTVQAPENFSVIPIEVGARLGFKEFAPRMFPYAMLTGGYTILTPQIYYQAPMGGPHFGVGGGVQYGTRLDGLSVGLEVLFRMVFNPSLPSLAVYPRIAYVF